MIVIKRIVRVLVLVKFGLTANAKCQIATKERLYVEVVSNIEGILDDDRCLQIDQTSGLFLKILFNNIVSSPC